MDADLSHHVRRRRFYYSRMTYLLCIRIAKVHTPIHPVGFNSPALYYVTR
jgi:hypothetical protein